MLVLPKYLQYLNAGNAIPSPTDTPPATPHSDATSMPWYVLEMRRTRWYDLFDADDRVEAMRGIWGVMAWLMRGEA